MQQQPHLKPFWFKMQLHVFLDVAIALCRRESHDVQLMYRLSAVHMSAHARTFERTVYVASLARARCDAGAAPPQPAVPRQLDLTHE